jgi:hypothetical protein
MDVRWRIARLGLIWIDLQRIADYSHIFYLTVGATALEVAISKYQRRMKTAHPSVQNTSAANKNIFGDLGVDLLGA